MFLEIQRSVDTVELKGSWSCLYFHHKWRASALFRLNLRLNVA